MKHSTPHGMFAVRMKVTNPQVLMPERKGDSMTSYNPTQLSGTFFRVSPQCSREIFAIQMLEHHQEKFAPAQGDGIIVTEAALLKFN